MICVSAGSKSRLAKAAGAEVAAQSRQEKWHAAVARSTFQVKMLKNLHCRSTFGSWDVENGTPLWREAHLQVKMLKNVHCRSTFGSCDVEKRHAAVARSTFQVKMLKTSIVGALLEVGMSKNGTPLWREAHFKSKC